MQLSEYLNAIYPLAPEVMEEYTSYWEPVAFKRGDFLTQEGQIERYLYFVQEGLQRSYYLKDGKEYTLAFTYPPSFTGVPDSFMPQKPSRYFLECVTESKLLRISHGKQLELMEKHRSLESLFRVFVQEVFVGIMQRYHELMAFSIEERLDSFLKRSPTLLNSISHKHIASYLRIDPSNLSKLLAKHRG